MKALLFVSAAIEVGAGLVVMALPSAFATFLLGSSLDSPAGLTVGRVAGAALLALGTACWLARRDWQGRAATGVVVAMAVYNSAVVVLLVGARGASGLDGIGLWPAVAVHLAMALWCLASLKGKRSDLAK